MASVVAMALAYLGPAVKDGLFFGPYDAGANGTIGHPGSPLNLATYNRLDGDIINQGIPWNTLDWRLVHAGHLPLWNSYNVLGLPQLFNFESAGFSLPALAGYAVPLRYAFTVTVLVKLLVAGIGTYVLCRQLAARPLPAAFGGISFMLSGGFASWLGWSLSGVVAFAPLVLAFMLLAYRDRRRRYVVLLAAAVMFAYFGGFPEMYALLAGALAAFALAAALALAALRRRVSAAGGLRVLAGLVLGTGLACPLLLPGAQLLPSSTHAAGRGISVGIPVSRLSLLVSAGYYGLPIRGSAMFPAINYYETVAYVGIVAIAAAVTGLVLARRQAAVVGLGVLTVVCLVASYRVGSFNPAGHLLALVGLRTVHASRVRLVGALGICCLAAVGIDRVVYRPDRSARVAWLVAALAGSGVVGALCWASAAEHLGAHQGAERFDSLLWPAGLAVALVLSAAVLTAGGRRRDYVPARCAVPVGLGLTGVQAAFVLFAGVGLNTWGHTGARQYPAATELRRLAGTGIVGLDGTSPSPKVWQRLGFYPDLNILYGVREFAGHDPLLPVGYARTWPVPPYHGRGRPTLSALDMPNISSAAVAWEYGISYLLLGRGVPLPAGTRLVATVGGERLARVEGAARFSFGGAGAGAGAGRVTSWSHPAENRWVLHVDAPQALLSHRLLVLRITRVPGFSATDGGRSLRIRPYGRFEMAVRVPRGTSTVTITYWPGAFTAGLAIAAACLVVLAGWCALPLLAGRRRGGGHAAHRQRRPVRAWPPARPRRPVGSG